MRSRFTLALVAVVAALACLPAAAAARRGCSNRGKTILKTATSRIFQQGKVRKGDSKKAPLYFGCILGKRKITRLNQVGEFGVNAVERNTITAAGPFVVVGVLDIAANEILNVLDVIDLRTGKVVRDQFATHLDKPSAFRVFLTPRGTLAWVVQDCVLAPGSMSCAQPVQNQLQVLLADSTVDSLGPPRVLAAGNDIAPNSLALSADTNTITWTQGGAAQASPIK